MVAYTWLEGTYTELYPDISLDAPGMQWLFRQFSDPGGNLSHAAPDVPGPIHEGGELDIAMQRIQAIQGAARADPAGARPRPVWPVIILCAPQGSTGPKQVGGLKTKGFWRLHQVPLSRLAGNPDHLALLEA